MSWIGNCAVWCAACGGYLLFAGVVNSRTELITAAVLASAAWLWAAALRRCARQAFRLAPAHALEWAKAVVAVGPALARTVPVFAHAAVTGRAPGRLAEIPFERGHEAGARDAARRASALLVASLGPDNYVVRMPPKRARVLLHVILPDSDKRDPRWLNP